MHYRTRLAILKYKNISSLIEVQKERTRGVKVETTPAAKMGSS